MIIMLNRNGSNFFSSGLRQKVANFPGVTVEHRVGKAPLPGHREVYLVDLPGVYSLSPRTEDELRRMFQSVLAERFGVGVHRERKEMQAYMLTVDKKGLKMTETAADGESMIEPQPKRMALAMQRTSMAEIRAVLAQRRDEA